MSAAKKIKMLLVEREMTLTDLSKLLNKSLSTMSGKMARDNFSEKDLKQIADILNYDYQPVLTDKQTGKQIKTQKNIKNDRSNPFTVVFSFIQISPLEKKAHFSPP